VVVVHNSELLSETNDSTGTSGLQLVSELLEHSCASLGSSGWGSSNLTTEDFRSELFVVQTSTSVFIIKIVKSIQILFGGDHDSNLLASFGELIWLDGSVVIQIKVFEALKKNGFLILSSV